MENDQTAIDATTAEIPRKTAESDGEESTEDPVAHHVVERGARNREPNVSLMSSIAGPEAPIGGWLEEILDAWLVPRARCGRRRVSRPDTLLVPAGATTGGSFVSIVEANPRHAGTPRLPLSGWTGTLRGAVTKPTSGRAGSRGSAS